MSRPIRLVVSDVDGTLVTRDKRLTPRVLEAVRRLDRAGIAFTIASSRPPVGLRMFVEPLRLRHPMGAFNGAALVTPDLTLLDAAFVPEDAARATLEAGRRSGADIWIFAGGEWIIDRPDGAYVAHERETIQADPRVVPDLDAHLSGIGKIVLASRDHAGLARLEAELQALLGDSAVAARSQTYYLDVTPPGVDKGTVVAAIARRLGITPGETMTIGDAHNDVPMFSGVGLSVAMGNAAPEVRAAAAWSTATNEESGFADAVERLLAEA